MTRWLFILCLLATSAFSEVDTLRGTTNTWDVHIRQNANYNQYDHGINTNLGVYNSAGNHRKLFVGTANLASVIGANRIITSMVLMPYANTEGDASIGMYEPFKPVYEGTKSAGWAEGATCWEGWYWDTAVAVVDSSWGAAGCNAASDTGSQNRGTNVSSAIKYPTSASGSWTDFANVYTSNNIYASYSGNKARAFIATGFGLAIPSDAIIDTVIAYYEGYYTTSVGQVDVNFTKDGTNVVGETWYLGLSLTESDAEHTSSGVAALWGTTFTPAEVNASTFGIKVANDAVQTTVYCDRLALRIAYHIGFDRTATAMDTVVVDSVGRFSFDIDTALANAWYTGTKDEFGVVFISNTADVLTLFTSSEGTEAQWPWFIVTHISSLEGGNRRRRLILEGD